LLLLLFLQPPPNKKKYQKNEKMMQSAGGQTLSTTTTYQTSKNLNPESGTVPAGTSHDEIRSASNLVSPANNEQ